MYGNEDISFLVDLCGLERTYVNGREKYSIPIYQRSSASICGEKTFEYLVGSLLTAYRSLLTIDGVDRNFLRASGSLIGS